MDTTSSTGGSAKPSATNATIESYMLLANGVRGAAVVGLIQQVIAANNLYVFGEILDHANVQAAKEDPLGAKYLLLLTIFAFGVYDDYLSAREELPPLDEAATKKLRLLTLASMASKEKLIAYADLQKSLHIDSVRELEDLIIEGASQNVVQGKLDQKNRRFEVEYAMARDIQKAEVPYVIKTLEDWYASCDGMLLTLESQVARANQAKTANKEHRAKVNRQISEIRGQLKAQQKITDATDDPDSRMDTDRSTDRRDKKNPGCGASGSGGGKGPKMGPRVAGKGLWPK